MHVIYWLTIKLGVELIYNFGAGDGPILYFYLNCIGTESTLADCSSSDPLSYGSVSHSSDAGVGCNPVSTTGKCTYCLLCSYIANKFCAIVRSDCSNGDVRLVNGTTLSEGRVEICYDGVWGSVCDSGWGDQDAAIVCLQLNFQGTSIYTYYKTNY